MQRLIRFFLLIAIRVFAVLTVVLWGVSQVRVIVANADAGPFRLVAMAVEGGFVVGATTQTAGWPPPGFYTFDSEDYPSWEGLYQRKMAGAVDRKSAILGGTMWLKRNSNSLAIGIRYWLAIGLLLLTYAAIKFFAAKKRISRMAELEV